MATLHAALPAHVASGGEVRVDVAVIGSGVAGLVTALDLLAARPEATVVLIDKGSSGESGSTPLAQGGLAAAVGPADSPALHAADTLRAGDGHCDPRAAAVMAAETPDRVADLQARGAVFDAGGDGGLALALEGGQTVARSVRSADATGAEIFRALRGAAIDAAASGAGLLRLQGMAVALTTAPTPQAPVTGLWLLTDPREAGVATPSQAGGLVLVLAKAVVLATGGCGGLYAATTNTDASTADSVALAGGVGAALQDLEFIQFHPTGLRADDPDRFQRFLLTEALRGAGAHLLDVDGRRFMPDRHPDAELAPRHVVARAILDQPGGAWLDARMIDAHQMAEEFPTVLRGAASFGYDLTAEPVPVEPCEHYMIGGVATDLHARTSVSGLYAAGEAATTGVHGANRMAGNSLAQSCVFGHRAALAIAPTLAELHVEHDPAPPTAGADDPALDLAAVRRAVRTAMSAGAGAIRELTGLQGAQKALEDLAVTVATAWGGATPPLQRDAQEIANMLVAGRAMIDSARLREETRGVHVRSDHPDADPRWAVRRQRVQLLVPGAAGA